MKSKKDSNKQYYDSHKEEIRITRKAYRDSHKEEIRIASKVSDEKYRNSEKGKAYQKNYYELHKEKLKANQKKYQQSEKGKIICNIHAKKYLQTQKGKHTHSKCEDKRSRDLNRHPLNKWFENSEGHHINKTDIIYIPKAWHFRGHSAQHNKNMESINTIAFFFLLIQNIKNINKYIQEESL